MEPKDYWKDFANTGDIFHYLRFKRRQNADPPREEDHAECDDGAGAAPDESEGSGLYPDHPDP